MDPTPQENTPPPALTPGELATQAKSIDLLQQGEVLAQEATAIDRHRRRLGTLAFIAGFCATTAGLLWMEMRIVDAPGQHDVHWPRALIALSIAAFGLALFRLADRLTMRVEDLLSLERYRAQKQRPSLTVLEQANRILQDAIGVLKKGN